jgi:hypothetical protein
MARTAAESHVEKRKALGFPLLRDEARRIEMLGGEDAQ